MTGGLADPDHRSITTDFDGEMAALDACGQAELVRTGQVAAAELVASAIRRLERADAALNLLHWRRFERGLRDAGRVRREAPLAGVPFLLKDLGAGAQRGEPMAMGNQALRQARWQPAASSALTRRWRDAGLVVVGRSAVPELGIQPTTQPLAFGPTRNPWDPSRSVAGSSGGAAAAVAVGAVPAAHASDSAGSIRMPAAWCGVLGLKPTRGLVPAARGASFLAVEMAVTRSVRDTAALLGIAAGRPVPLPETGRLRIGVVTEAWDVAVDAECREATLATARALTELGHHVEPVQVLLGEPATAAEAFALVRVAMRMALDGIAARIGRPLGPGDAEPFSFALAEGAEPARLASAAHAVRTFGDRVAGELDRLGLDLLLTPGTASPPLRLEELVPGGRDPLRIRDRYAEVWTFARPFNQSGQPALVVPVAFTRGGLPLAAQLVGRRGDDARLLAVAAELEAAGRLLPLGRRPPDHRSS